MNKKRLPLIVGIVLLVALAFIGVASACDYGCSPGYWKNTDPNNWPAPLKPVMIIGGPIIIIGDSGGTITYLGSVDLNGDGKLDSNIDALKYQGGSGSDGARRILLRAAVAAAINEAAFGDAFPATTETANAIGKAYISGDRKAMIDLAGQLNSWNNIGCPL
jgi:hypothetical protein